MVSTRINKSGGFNTQPGKYKNPFLVYFVFQYGYCLMLDEVVWMTSQYR
jgi:hypothetical protein